MFKLWVLRVLGLLLLAAHPVLGSIISVLATFDELSTLNSHINASETLSNALLAANNITFIAPSNAAFEAYLAALAPSTPSEEDIIDLLDYHFIIGGYPGALFTSSPQFVHSHLPNGEYANVTGGQVVEILSDANGKPQLITGNKTVTPIVQQDILFAGGIIHIVDQMLVIPPSPVVELTEAHLTLGVALLNDAGLLTVAAQSTVASIFGVQDVTIFMPNSQEAITSFRAISAVHSSAADLAAIFNYHQIPNVVGYSHLLQDGSTWKTGQGRSVKVTIEGNDTFIDGAKIIGKDYLIANGVMHIIDDTLNPFNATTPPVEESSTSTAGVSQAVLGVTLSLAFLVPVCGGILLFWWFARRRRTGSPQSKEMEYASEGAYARQISIPVTEKRDDYELEDSSPISGAGEGPPRNFPPRPPAVFTLYPGQTRTLAVELDAGSVRRADIK